MLVEGPVDADLDAVFQLTLRDTVVEVTPRLEALVDERFPDPRVAAETLRSTRDSEAESDGLRLRRASLGVDLASGQRVTARLELDAARLLYEEELYETVREAYAELALGAAAALRVGAFDVPFSLLDRANNPSFEFADSPRVHGLVDHLRFAGRQVGAGAVIAPLEERDRFELQVGFRGAPLPLPRARAWRCLLPRERGRADAAGHPGRMALG